MSCGPICQLRESKRAFSVCSEVQIHLYSNVMYGVVLCKCYVMWDHRRGREELERRRVEQRARLEAEAKWLVEERKRREEDEQKHAEEERTSAEEEKALRAMQEAALLQKQVRDVLYEYCTVLESALVRLPSDIYAPSN